MTVQIDVKVNTNKLSPTEMLFVVQSSTNLCKDKTIWLCAEGSETGLEINKCDLKKIRCCCQECTFCI